MNTFYRSIKEVYKACPFYMITMVALILLSGGIPAFNIYITGELVDTITSKSANEKVSLLILLWGATLIIPELLHPLVGYIQANINQLLTSKVTHSLMEKSSSFNGLDVYFDSKMQTTISILESQSRFRPTNFAVNLVLVAKESATLLSISILLYNILWWSPIIILIGFIPLAISNFKVAEYSWKSLLSVGAESRFLSYLSGLSFKIDAQRELHLHNAFPLIEEKYFMTFSKINGCLKKARFSMLIKPIPYQILTTIVVVYVLNSIYSHEVSGEVLVSSMVVVLQSLYMLSGRADSLVSHGALITEIMDYFNHYFSFIDKEDNIKSGQYNLDKIEKIEFKSVSFKYKNSPDFALDKVSFILSKNESVAIVGENGAGKTTIINLICRFWDVTSGNIYINDINIKEYDIHSLRSCIGAVFQDFFKFNFSVKENITLSTKEEDVNFAINTSGFPSNIDQNQNLGRIYDGIELSGGQWQKLTIARCFHKNSSLVILDEATSAIDPKAETALYRSFSRASNEKMCIMVTHRLGAVNQVDRVLVLSKGKVVQSGELNVLKHQEGEFKELWDLQASMYS
ncbi:ABC transporter ATP-binding protein [Vibrio hyugaensis]|uniref:ABC transporter ATP-binding protein n=1 Tax=Vibrio hyugaensis TaxID=1534743 RepID=UPI0005EFB908|nr:ABC transporter ATP-binding protein [Vibrio hyugaensis]